MVLRFVFKMFIYKSFYQLVLFGWLCFNIVFGEYKYQLQRNRNFYGILEEFFDLEDIISKLKCYCKFMNVFLCYE